MAKPDAVFIYIGTYPSEAAARADYDIAKDVHAAGAAGTYDVAVVTKNGLSSLQTALSHVQTSAKTFAADAKSAYPSQTTALKNSLSSLDTAIKSAKGQPPLTAAAAVAPSVTQVKNSASDLQSAVKGKCQ